MLVESILAEEVELGTEDWTLTTTDLNSDTQLGIHERLLETEAL